jgi:chromosome segregation ATPase
MECKDEIENLRNQLLRKDSHVTSLESSLTQKNEELESLEEKLQKLFLENKTSLLILENEKNSEIEELKNKLKKTELENISLDSEIKTKHDEISSFRRILSDYEEQKLNFCQKINEYEEKFSHLENNFENTIANYVNQINEKTQKFEFDRKNKEENVTIKKNKMVNTQTQCDQVLFRPSNEVCFKFY